MHRSAMPLLLGLAALAAPAAAVAAAEPARKLNVLFFVVDDLRPELGCYGNRLIQTPHIDKLAAGGVRFDRAYCQFPVCNPSRSSFLTSRYPASTEVMENVRSFRDRLPDAVTLPQHFRAHGYYTAHVGKIFHSGIDDEKSWVEGGEPQQKNRKPQTPAQAAQFRKQSERTDAVEGKGENLADYQTASRAMELLEKHKEGPFFLAVGFVRPHTPLVAPKSFYDLYDPAKMPLPPDFAPRPTPGPGVPREALGENYQQFSTREATPETARAMVAAYYACTSFMDAQVGRVLDTLERLNLRDNTVVVFFSDHGYHLGEKGRWAKHGSVYEIAARVPLLIAVPSSPNPGKASPRVVGLIDLYPTLVDLCGLPAAQGPEGRSLTPLLKDPEATWDHPTYSMTRQGKAMGQSVRTERWRYTEWDAEGKKAELYDHDTDPHELRNLAGDPKHAETVQQLRQLLKAGPNAAHLR